MSETRANRYETGALAGEAPRLISVSMTVPPSGLAETLIWMAKQGDLSLDVERGGNDKDSWCCHWWVGNGACITFAAGPVAAVEEARRQARERGLA